MAQAMAQPAPQDTKIERMYKLKVARQAVLDVHRTTQVGESADFAEDQRKAQLRESEIAQQAHSEEELADQGAEAEAQEYDRVFQ